MSSSTQGLADALMKSKNWIDYHELLSHQKASQGMLLRQPVKKRKPSEIVTLTVLRSREDSFMLTNVMVIAS